MYAGGGVLVDRLGTRRGFLAIMIFWSLACASHALAAGFGMLAVSRFLLGLGEGGGFPAATKAIAEWFPVTERSTAMGVVNAGTAVGAVVAPPVIAAILLGGSWRWVFVACGAAGLVWALWWWRTYLPPDRHSAVAVPFIRAHAVVHAAHLPRGLGSRRGEVPHRRGVVLLHLVAAQVPLRRAALRRETGRSFYAWVPYAASGVGCLLGGWLSSALIRRGRSVDFSRKLALGLSAAVMPAIVFVTHVPVEWALVIFSLAFFGQQSWSTLVMIVPTDLFERSVVASVAGLVGFGGAMGGLLMNLAAGRLLDAGFGYGTVFAGAGTLHVIAFVVIVVAIRIPDVRD